MEFECSNMTVFGCASRDAAKELMLQEMIESEYSDLEICKNACCIGCEESCSYRCSRSNLQKEKRMIPTRDSEEVIQEKLLGIRCYRCGKEINREGTEHPMVASGIGKVWICKECIKEMCGPGTYTEHKEDVEDPNKEFRESNIEKIEYEQLSFL